MTEEKRDREKPQEDVKKVKKVSTPVPPIVQPPPGQRKRLFVGQVNWMVGRPYGKLNASAASELFLRYPASVLGPSQV